MRESELGEPSRPRELVRLMLRDADFPGAGVLRMQVDELLVCSDSGTEVRFLPASDVATGGSTPNPLPVMAAVFGPDGETVGLLHLWTTNGLLATLEQDWFTGSPPQQMPDPSMIVVRANDREFHGWSPAPPHVLDSGAGLRRPEYEWELFEGASRR